MTDIQSIKKELAAGSYDERLSYIYCCPREALTGRKDRILRVMEGYKKEFGKEDSAIVGLYSAPGRTELGGNHTDHQLGCVLTGSVDLDAIACAAPAETGRIRLFSEGFGMTEIDCGDVSIHEAEKNSTAAIVRGVLRRFTELGCTVTGLDAYITSDVPGGGGLSSSACFEVLVGTVFNELFFDGKVTSQEIAMIGQYAENVYFGKPSGLLDQMGCAVGGAVFIDFGDRKHPVVRPVSYDFTRSGYTMFMVDTGSDHSGLTEDYSSLPTEMKAAAAVFGKEVLSRVEPETFFRNIPQVRKEAGDRAVLRALHYFAETERAKKQAEALEKEDFGEYLRLVNASGNSSYKFLQNIDTHRDPAYQPIAMALGVSEYLLKEKGASRVHGGGFAGAIQVYVENAEAEDFRAAMDTIFGDGACRPTAIRPVGGCNLLK